MEREASFPLKGLAFWCALSAAGCSGAKVQPSTDLPAEGTFVQARSARTSDTSRPSEDGGYRSTGVGSVFLSSLPLHTPAEVQNAAFEAESDEELALQVGVSWTQRGPVDDELARRFPELAHDEGTERVRIPSFHEVPASTSPGREKGAPSFVIDYDDASVARLVREHFLAKMTPEQLEAFVHHHIERKTYTRGFDIASRVAKQRAGDCTEHAVLLTSLLRATGRPARVAIGVVLAFTSAAAIAGGHAWTEYFDSGTWRRLDAALFQPHQVALRDAPQKEEGVPVFGLAEGGKARDGDAQPVLRRLYLTRFFLEDEGPGYRRAYSGKVVNLGVEELWLHASTP